MRLAAVTVATAAALLLAGCSGGTVQQFSVGECLDDPTLREEGALHVGELPVVDCGGSHWAEVFYVEDIDADAFSENFAELATEACEREFEGYVGAHFAQTPYDPSPMYPTEGSWSVGDRQIVCLLIDDGGNPLIGSAKGTGTA